MAKTVSARKSKGRNLQKEVVMALRKRYEMDFLQGDDCYNGDITSRVLGATGTDIVISPHAKNLIPFSIETKCQERLDVWGFLKQAEANAEEGMIPLLVFKRNRSETYCCLKFKDLLGLIR